MDGLRKVNETATGRNEKLTVMKFGDARTDHKIGRDRSDLAGN